MSERTNEVEDTEVTCSMSAVFQLPHPERPSPTLVRGAYGEIEHLWQGFGNIRASLSYLTGMEAKQLLERLEGGEKKALDRARKISGSGKWLNFHQAVVDCIIETGTAILADENLDWWDSKWPNRTPEDD